MIKCECNFCKESVYKEHDEIICDSLKENIKNSKHKDKLLTVLKENLYFLFL